MATFDNLPAELIDKIFKIKQKNFERECFENTKMFLEHNLKFFSNVETEHGKLLEFDDGYIEVFSMGDWITFTYIIRKPFDLVAHRTLIDGDNGIINNKSFYVEIEHFDEFDETLGVGLIEPYDEDLFPYESDDE